VPRISEKASLFTESVIRDMTRQILQHHGAAGVNLAQGFPDFAAPDEIKAAACQAIQDDHNQYAITWGQPPLRQALAEKYEQAWKRPVDPEREITVCCGATETMLASIMAIIDPCDEVVCFSPFYENYGPDCILSGAVPRFVTLRAPEWTFDEAELRAAFGPRTRAIVVNTPHNPTGKVFSVEELELIAGLCRDHGAIAITDEIYEHLVFAGAHVSIATLPGMAERTITISGASKTFSVTGWRVGWLIAPPALTAGIRKVHDFLTVGAAHPLQVAVAAGLRFPDAFYDSLLEEYRERRDALVGGLSELGFAVRPPDGAYYVMAGIGGFGDAGDVAFARRLVEELAVATVPASSFFHDPALGRGHVRFSFPKRMETIRRGLDALRPLAAGAS
jgi:L-glutamine---4-(methylsulfanyl)-2-oxobutanoate aminotransferase